RYYGITEALYSEGTEIELSALPSTESLELDPTIADISILEMKQRAYRPYPPGNITAKEQSQTKEWGVLVNYYRRYRGGEQLSQAEPTHINPPNDVELNIHYEVWSSFNGE